MLWLSSSVILPEVPGAFDFSIASFQYRFFLRLLSLPLLPALDLTFLAMLQMAPGASGVWRQRMARMVSIGWRHSSPSTLPGQQARRSSV